RRRNRFSDRPHPDVRRAARIPDPFLFAHRAAEQSVAPFRARGRSFGRRKRMELALFGIGALLTTVSSVIAATLYVWTWLRTARPNQALVVLIALRAQPRTWSRSISASPALQ